MNINPLPDGHPDTNRPDGLSDYAAINATIVENAPNVGAADVELVESWKALCRKHSAELWQNIWANIPRIRSWRGELRTCQKALEEAGQTTSEGLRAKVATLEKQVSEWMTYTKGLMALDRRVKSALRKFERPPTKRSVPTRIFAFSKCDPAAPPLIFTRISPPLSREERKLIDEEDRRGGTPEEPTDLG
jgi:hypothetical protein